MKDNFMIEVKPGVIHLDKEGCLSVVMDQGCGCCGYSYYKAIEGTVASNKYPHMVGSKEESIAAVESAKLALKKELETCDDILKRITGGE